MLLNTKDGKTWVIYVEWRNGNIWLGPGWHDFKNNYKFKIFDTLLFKYKGTSNFTVYIFNGLGLEYGWEDLGPYDTPAPFFKQIGSNHYVNKFVCLVFPINLSILFFPNYIFITGKLFITQVIPDEFTFVYSSQIANPLTLVGTDDREWTVKWAKVDSSIWLTEGWANFALYYNLKKKDYLMFKVCHWIYYVVFKYTINVSFICFSSWF